MKPVKLTLNDKLYAYAGGIIFGLILMGVSIIQWAFQVNWMLPVSVVILTLLTFIKLGNILSKLEEEKSDGKSNLL